MRRVSNGDNQAGSLNAENLEELLTAVYADALRIGPTVDAIYAWAEQGIEKERRRARTTGGENLVPVRLHLTWQNAVIDQAQSWIAAESDATEAGAAFDSSEVERLEESEETTRAASA